MNTETRFVKIASQWRSAAKSYTVTPVFPTQKGGFSSAANLNRYGRVVGQAAAGPRALIQAFCWDSMAGLTPSIGTLAGKNTIATNINEHGLICGYAEAANGMLRAFVSDGTQLYDLGLLCDTKLEGAFSVATDMNAEAQVAGYSHNHQGTTHAFIWEYEQGMRDLGTLGGAKSYAYALNDSGVVVGWSQVLGDPGYRAFRWTKEVGMHDLGSPAATVGSLAYGINTLGQIVGSAGTGVYGNVPHATLWDEASFRDLGSLPDFPFSSAYALNNTGQAVGWAYVNSRDDLKKARAFVWDAENEMRDLTSLLPSDTGWTIHKATGINDDGQIVGVGSVEGRQQAVLLTPVGYGRDVSRFVEVKQFGFVHNSKSGAIYRTLLLKNISHEAISGPIQILFSGLTEGVQVANAGGMYDGVFFRTVQADTLAPGDQISTTVQFYNPYSVLIQYEPTCYAGEF